MKENLIVRMGWGEFDVSISALTDALHQFEPDLVVGIVRGGLPLAVALSHQLGQRRFGMIGATMSANDETFAPKSLPQFRLLSLPDDPPESVLVVDDMCATGTVFSKSRAAIADFYGRESIPTKFASLYGDPQGVRTAGNEAILDDLYLSFEVDKQSTWVVYPWERDDSTS